MADYIFIRKSRNAISSLVHAVLNLLLAVISIGATVVTGNCLIGLILIIVSKWRVFAVNHRYWWVNIRSSLVDFIVGISFVLLAYAAGQDFLPVHIVLVVAYSLWLTVIKPRSSLKFAMVQALIAVLVGSTTVSVFAPLTIPYVDAAMLVMAEFIIGYAASRHVLIQGAQSTQSSSQYAQGGSAAQGSATSMASALSVAKMSGSSGVSNMTRASGASGMSSAARTSGAAASASSGVGRDASPGLISMVLGLFFAEIAWLSNAWLIIYSLGRTGICVSQLALILTLLAFAYFSVYHEVSKRKTRFHFKDVALPVVFAVVVIAVLIIGFSQPRFNISH